MSRGPAATRVFAAALAVCIVPLPAMVRATPAEDVVAAPGTLGDAAFYRLVSCAAPPGGDCARPAVRWRTESPIRVALRRIDPVFVGRQRPRADAALTRAIGELNGAGARFRLSRVAANDRAEIVLYFLDAAPDGTIAGTGIDWVDGAEIDDIATLIAVDPERTRIRAAAIVATPALETRAYEAAVLTALTRAMGLATAMDAPAYDGLSVLAHGVHEATRLGPQDIVALRRHYAPEAP